MGISLSLALPPPPPPPPPDYISLYFFSELSTVDVLVLQPVMLYR